MATVYTAWSKSYTPSGSSVAKKFRGAISYYSYDNTNTSISYTINPGVQVNSGVNVSYSVTGSATGVSSVTKTLKTYTDITDDWFGGSDAELTPTYTKGHSAVTKTFKVSLHATNAASASGWNTTVLTKSVTVTIPARPSYAVTYNMNGGSGSIASQTKWYGETLTLSSTKPTRSGYTFRGWATSASGSVAYASGANYTGNAALNLYAVWHRAPSLTPTVTSTAPYYIPLTDYVVSISGLTTYDSATATVTLKLGTQSVSRTSNGTLTISPSVVGTFTPTVVVTDSLGASTTYTLPAVTINKYTEPSALLLVERTSATGEPADEGQYAVVTVTFTFTDAIATLIAPTVSVTADDETSETATLTWYSSQANNGSLSGSVNWSSLTSGATVYGLVSITGGFNIQKAYQISVTPQDSEGTGITVTQTLSTAFYTVDFLAGGHGVAFGKPSTQEGFEVDMNARFLRDVYIGIDENAAAGTVDGDLYEALNVLGWI